MNAHLEETKRQIAVLNTKLDDLRQERREAEVAFDSRKSELIMLLYEACREEERLTGLTLDYAP